MARVIAERMPQGWNRYRHVAMGKGSPWDAPKEFHLQKGER